LKEFGISFPNNHFLKLLLVISIFIFAAFFVPVIGPFFMLLFPMVLFVNGIVVGAHKTAAAFLISFSLFLFPAIFLGMNVPFVAVFTMGIAGLFIAKCAAQNQSVEKTIIYPSVFIVAVICFFFIYEGYISSMSAWLVAKKFIGDVMAESVKFQTQLPLSTESIKIIKDSEKDMVSVITLIFPSFVVVSAASVIWMNLLLGKNYLARAGIILPKYTALARWKAPDFIVWIFITSGALWFVPYENMKFFGLNLFLVVCFVYLLQGLAIVSFFFQSKNVPLFFRYLFYFLIAVQYFLMIPIIASAGLIDIWIDFRKFFQKDQTTD